MRRASNIAAILAAALVVLGLGGVHTAVAGAAAGLALAAMALQVGHLQGRERRVLVSLVGLAALLAAAACLIQLVPLPPFVHAILNPTELHLYEHGLELAGLTNASWRPLSLDPAVTGDRAIRYIALGAIAVWAANVRSRRAWRAFAAWFVPLALVDLVLGLVLVRTRAHSFLGLYEPTVGFRGPSTFISTNHGAAFFGLAALVAAAAALGERREHPRRAGLFGISAFALVAAALSMDSDGVLLALVSAAAMAAVVQWFRRGRPTTVRRDLQIGAGLVTALVAIAAWWLDLHHAAIGFLTRVLFSGEHGGRLELLKSGLSALGDFWRFGAGAGSIETLLPAYVDWSHLLSASIPLIENDTMELALSFGVPLALLMVLAGLVQIADQAKSAVDPTHSPRYAVAIVCAVYAAAIAQLHFPLFALGIALPALIWFELLWSRRTKSSRSGRVFSTGHVMVSSRVAWVGVVVASVGMLLAAQAHYSWYASSLSAEPTEGQLAHEIWLRPASHVPYVKLATLAARHGELDKAVRLADYAVEREPSPRVKLYRARVLGRVDSKRAADAFAELFAAGHTNGRFTEAFVSTVSDVNQRIDVLEPYPDIWADAARRMRRLGGSDAASSFVVGLAERRPNDVKVYRLASSVYLSMGQPVLSELWAELARDAEARGGVSEIVAPLLLSRALRASGRTAQARKILDDAATDPNLVRDAHREALELRGPPSRDLADFVQRHYDAYCPSPVPKPDLRLCWMTESWLLETHGDLSKAESVLSRLWRRLNDPGPLATFYLRNADCDELEALVRELEPGAQRDYVETLADRCHR